MNNPHDFINVHTELSSMIQNLTQPLQLQREALASTAQIRESLESITQIRKALDSTIELREALSATSQIREVLTTASQIREALMVTSQIREVLESATSSSQIISQLGTSVVQQTLSEIGSPIRNIYSCQTGNWNLQPVLTAANTITIHPTYVDIPSALIPDIPDDDSPSPDSSSASSSGLKHVSKEQAYHIIYDLIMLLLTVLALLRTEIDSMQSQKDRTEDVALMQAQLEAANQTNDYLLTLIDQLADNQESAQTSDLISDDKSPQSPASDSNSDPDSESQPTSDDAPNNSETLTVTE